MKALESQDCFTQMCRIQSRTLFLYSVHKQPKAIPSPTPLCKFLDPNYTDQIGLSISLQLILRTNIFRLVVVCIKSKHILFLQQPGRIHRPSATNTQYYRLPNSFAIKLSQFALDLSM